MTAFSPSRFMMFVFAMIAPVVLAIACATEPPDPDDGGNSCGNSCAFGQRCVDGKCECDSPYEACGISCFNLNADPNNCGTCGNICPPSMLYCSSRVCSATCALTTCPGNVCTNLQTDQGNCGVCGTRCAIGASCVSGSCACPAGETPCNGVCAASCGSGGTGGTGTGGTSGTGTGGTTSTGGTVTGGAGGMATGGAAGAGTAGAAGMGPVMKLCATKVVPAAPTITDFETYDGTTPAFGTGSWIFTMGPTTAPAYAGLYALSEGTVGETPPATYTLAMAAGANASNWAARAANPMTTDWGGGVGMWMGCINASTYSGISFYVRGSSPTSMANLSLAMEDATAPDAANPAGGGTCTPAPTDGCAGPSYTFPLTVDWTQITVPWAMFTAGRGAAGAAIVPNGDEITGISFGVGIVYSENPVGSGTYLPEPGAFEIAIDNLAFTP